MKLEGKRAIVTGAASGIGKATAIRLAAEGAAVVISDINADKLGQVEALIKAQGGRAFKIVTDVSNKDQVQAMVDLANEQLGGVDILVNNAGGAARLKQKPFHESDETLWNWIIGVNLMGAFICTRAVIEQMMAQKYGKIINMSSIAGVIGAGGGVEYAAAKGGIIALTKSLAKAYGKYGITVNCLAPGAITTEGMVEGRPGIMEGLAKTTHLGRAGTAEEVAGMIAYLASSEADFVTGQNFIIDGGRSLGS
ncbi:MAG: SDR family NAD(P)-dependent oxidoreductase [Bacillota bacterium]|nr:SDR family NAD(P)-dependent oxidoreductase [Bacillota bacterium]